MSRLDLILASDSFHEADQLRLKEIFSDPLVVRYLKHLAIEDNKELVNLPVLDMASESIGKRHTMVQGRLSAYTTLLLLSTNKEQ